METKNIVYIGRSLDGYIAGKNGERDWLDSVPNSQNVEMGYTSLMQEIDALVMGRTTFEVILNFIFYTFVFLKSLLKRLNMKRFFLISLSLIFCSTLSFGQSKAETEIRRLEAYWSDLLDKSDTTALRKVWSKDYIVNNPAGKIITGEDIIGFIRNGQRFPAYERIIESITFSENIAIVLGKEVSQPQKKATGTEQKITRRFTNIWIKSKKTWKLLARQATNMPTS